MRLARQPRSIYQVAFRGEPAKVEPVGRVARVARLLALAHKIDRRIHDGELADLADAARSLNITRARVTQIMNLLLLAPAIQEAILGLPPVTTGRDPISERQLRPITGESDWNRQLELWRQIDV